MKTMLEIINELNHKHCAMIIRSNRINTSANLPAQKASNWIKVRIVTNTTSVGMGYSLQSLTQVLLN